MMIYNSLRSGKWPSRNSGYGPVVRVDLPIDSMVDLSIVIGVAQVT